MSAIQMVLRFEVNLQDPLVTQVLTTSFQQGDADANVIEVALKNGTENAEIEQSTVNGYMLRADGERVLLSGTVSGSTVRVTLKDACYQVPGVCGLIIRLGNADGIKRTILRITAIVESEGDGPVIDTENRIPSVEDVIAKLEEMDRAIQDAEEATEKANNAAKPPYVGDDGNWMVWDETENGFVNSGTKASGPEGERGPAGKPPYIGEDGNWYYWSEEENGYYNSGVRAQGEQGIQGERGETGKPFKILGTYASLDDLNAAVPSPEQGDIYNVGAEEPYSMYMWDTTGGSGHWLYLGELGSGGSGTVQSVDGVLPDEDGNVAVNAVRYDGQTLTSEQKATARSNLAVYSKQEVNDRFASTAKTFVIELTVPRAEYWGEPSSSRPYYICDVFADGISDELVLILGSAYDVIVSPVPDYLPLYADCGMYLYECDVQHKMVTFYAKKPPETMLNVNLLFIG